VCPNGSSTHTKRGIATERAYVPAAEMVASLVGIGSQPPGNAKPYCGQMYVIACVPGRWPALDTETDWRSSSPVVCPATVAFGSGPYSVANGISAQENDCQSDVAATTQCAPAASQSVVPLPIAFSVPGGKGSPVRITALVRNCTDHGASSSTCTPLD